MGFKNAGFPHYAFNPMGFKITKSLAVPFRSDLLQWNCGEATNSIVPDKLGRSGVLEGRPEVDGYVFDGDGTRYVGNIPIQSLGTNHTIEFESTLNSTATQAIIGNTTIANNWIYFSGGNSIVYRTENSGGTGVFNISPHSDYRTYKIVRTNTTVELFINDVSQGTRTLSVNENLNIDIIFNRGIVASIIEENVSYIDLNGYTAYFESGNQDTDVYFINRTTNDYFTGQIQSATGSDRIIECGVLQDMNFNGVTVSDGVTYYKESSLTNLVPSGKRSPDINGNTVWWISDGAGGSVQAPSEFPGLLKADIRIVNGVGWYGGSDFVPSAGDITSVFKDSNVATVSNAVAGTFKFLYWEISLNASTLYTVKNQSVIVQGTSATAGVDIFDSLGAFIKTVNNNASDTVTVPADGIIRLQMNITNAVSEIGVIDAGITVFEGTTQPTSGQPVVGNSWIQATSRKDLVDNDALTTTTQYDGNCNPLLNEITGPTVDNPLFIQTDPWCLLQYDRVLTDDQPAEEYTKVLRYLKLVSAMLDINGDPLFDVNGYALYNLNDGVEVI